VLLQGIFLLLDQSLDSDLPSWIGGYYMGRFFLSLVDFSIFGRGAKAI